MKASFRSSRVIAFALVVAGLLGARLVSGVEPTAECWSITRLENQSAAYASSEEAAANFAARMRTVAASEADAQRAELFRAMAWVALSGTLTTAADGSASATIRAVDAQGLPAGALELTQLQDGWVVSEIRVKLPLDACDEA